MDKSSKEIADIRNDYQQAQLLERDALENPIRQFQQWFEQAQEQGVDEVNAMTLATVDEQGGPSARIVLLKGLDEEGFRFYTNYNSRKGRELTQNSRACLVFFWKEMERQVRIDGEVYRLSEEESTAYFHSRPKSSQLGAWVSEQSIMIKDRSVLEERKKELEAQYAEFDQLPKPPHWGGFIVKPYKIEFWQGRPSRLHDRLVYTLKDLNPKRWKIERLAP